MGLARLIAFAAALSFMVAIAPTAASAATAAVAVTSVNMRAGPGTHYPAVATLPASAALSVYGCTASATWCDASWGRNRGWVSANYVQVIYRGNPVVVTPAIAPAIGLGVVAFSHAYWNTYYAARPWYGQWNSYYRPGPYALPGRGVAGCNGYACGGAVAGPGGVAVGHCSAGACSGTVVHRGPYGHRWIRHSSVTRY